MALSSPKMPPGTPTGRASRGAVEIVTRLTSERDASGAFVLNGRYRFVAVLGSGAYGEVILAQDLNADPKGSQSELVAIKSYSKSRLMKKRTMLGSGPKARVVTAVEKVQSEILIMQALLATSMGDGDGNNSGIIRLRSVITQAGVDDLYLVLDYAPGGQVMELRQLKPKDGAGPLQARYSFTAQVIVSRASDNAASCSSPPLMIADITASSSLNERIKRSGGSLPVPLVGALTRDLLQALRRCHDNVNTNADGAGAASFSCAHRDVKPDNLLLLGSSLVLSDFGVARAFGPDYDHEEGVEGESDGEEADEGSPGASAEVAGSSSTSGAIASAQRHWETRHAPAPKLELEHEGAVCSPNSGARKNVAPSLPRGWVKDTAGSFLFLPPEACGAGDEAGGDDHDGGSSAGSAGGGGGYCAYCGDVWAAGVTMYCLLFGRLPFGETSTSAEASGGGSSEWYNAVAVFEALSRARLPDSDRDLPWGSSFYMNMGACPLDRVAVVGTADAEIEGRAEDVSACLSLLRRLLEPDPDKRATAAEALRHPFLERAASKQRTCRFAFAPRDKASFRPYKNLAMEVAASFASASVSAAPATSPSTPAAAAPATTSSEVGKGEAPLGVLASPSRPQPSGSSSTDPGQSQSRKSVGSPSRPSPRPSLGLKSLLADLLFRRLPRGSTSLSLSPTPAPSAASSARKLIPSASSVSSSSSSSSSSLWSPGSLSRRASAFMAGSSKPHSSAAIAEEGAGDGMGGDDDDADAGSDDGGAGRGDDDEDASLPTPVILSGWLMKRGRVWPAWRRRFFVLRGERMRYYKDDRFFFSPHSTSASSSSRSSLRGSVDVSAVSRVALVDADSSAFSLQVEGAGAGQGNRTLHLRADSVEDRGRWVKAIETLRTGLRGHLTLQQGNAPSS